MSWDAVSLFRGFGRGAFIGELWDGIVECAGLQWEIVGRGGFTGGSWDAVDSLGDRGMR